MLGTHTRLCIWLKLLALSWLVRREYSIHSRWVNTGVFTCYCLCIQCMNLSSTYSSLGNRATYHLSSLGKSDVSRILSSYVIWILCQRWEVTSKNLFYYFRMIYSSVIAVAALIMFGVTMATLFCAWSQMYFMYFALTALYCMMMQSAQFTLVSLFTMISYTL